MQGRMGGQQVAGRAADTDEEGRRGSREQSRVKSSVTFFHF
jgi:hypothetical protein